MADPKTPGDMGDGVKNDAKDTATKAGADTFNDIAADPSKASASDIAEKRKEDAKKAAVAMLLKNEEIAKQMAIAEAMNVANNALGGIVPGSMMPMADNLMQSGLNEGANSLEKQQQKLTDIKPSEPSV